MYVKNNFHLSVVLLILAFAGCSPENDRPYWKSRFVAPIAQTTLTLNNLVKSGELNEASDNSLILSLEEELYTIGMDSLVKLNTPPFERSKTLDSLRLDPSVITQEITLGQFARQLEAEGNPIGALLLSSQGSFLFVPGGTLNNLTGGPYSIDLNQFFEDALIKKGFMDVRIDNGLPLTINRLDFTMQNASPPQALIANPVFTSIASGASATQTYDLANTFVEGTFDVSIQDADLGGGFITVDTNDAISITVTVRDVRVQEATAIFPAQNVIEESAENYLEGLGSIQLKEIIIGSGFVRIEVSSTLPDTLFFSYKFPNAIKNGVSFETNTIVPPSGGGNQVFNYDFSGYTVDLTGEPGHDTVNAFYNELLGRIENTGEKVTLTLDDYMTVKISLVDAIPNYMRGYLGDTVLEVQATQSIEVFKNVLGGSLDLEMVNTTVTLENGLGVSANATLNSLSATRGASTIALSSGAVGGAGFAIARATEGPPVVPSITTIDLNSGGGNMRDLINLMPTQLYADVDLSINPGLPVTYNDFAYAESPLKIKLKAELPLSLIASSLTLSDTVSLTSDPSAIAQIEAGFLNMIVDNGFPLNAGIVVYIHDQTNTVIDSLSTSEVIQAASLNGLGKVSEKRRTILRFELNQTRSQNLQVAKFVSFKVVFDTKPDAQYVKIYSDYGMDFKLVGDVSVYMNKK
jgi:hypothetical protein